MQRRNDHAWASRRKNFRSSILLVFVAAAALAALVLPGSAATGTAATKSYTANICASGPCVPPVTPPTLAGGSTATVALTIANQTSPQSLGSANVTAPAGFTVTGTSALPSGSSFAGGLIKLRNLNIASGSPQTFAITVSVPCQSSSSAWAITAKQSNDFNGPPGNAFTLDPSNSSLTTPVTGVCKLVFVKQPTNAQVGKTITSVADNPTADPVKVEVHDGSDQLVTTATGTVTLAPSSNATSFSGNTNIALFGGAATFLSLKSSATGTYTLIASGSGFASSDPSDQFVISDFGTICPAGDTTCTGSASSSDKKTKSSVTSSTSSGFGQDTTLEITMLTSGPPTGACAGFTPAPGSDGVSVDVRPLTDLTEVTITLDKSIVNAIPDNGASHFNVCFGGKIVDEDPAVTPFTTKSGTPAAVFDSGTGLFWGILPDCSGTPTEPCVASRNKTGSGSVVIVFDVPNPWDLRGYTG